MVVRKKKIIDGIDREILRNLRAMRRPLTGRQLAIKVGMSPSAINPRLNMLKRKGIITDKCSKVRTFNRKFGTKTKRIKSCAKRSWKLDLR